jgi:hypothetical protein
VGTRADFGAAKNRNMSGLPPSPNENQTSIPWSSFPWPTHNIDCSMSLSQLIQEVFQHRLARTLFRQEFLFRSAS